MIQKANMIQIAEDCGVSLKTVSRVINHPEQVSPKTKEIVRRSMEKCGFQVNLLAKGLKQNRTNIIIIFLDKHNGEYMNQWRNNMLQHLLRYSVKSGLKVIVSPSDSKGFKGDETDGFYLLSSGIADGAILFEYVEEDQRLEYLEKTKIPYVLLAQPKEKQIPAVSLDNYDVGARGGQYLREKGYKKICYLTNDQQYYSTQLRVGGFLESVPDGRVIYGIKDAKDAYETARNLIAEDAADCFFVNGGTRFLGIYRAVQESGKRIPKDIGVFSTNHLPINEEVYPTLSSLNQDFDQLAEKCMNMLSFQLDQKQHGGEWERKQIFLPSTVAERESTM